MMSVHESFSDGSGLVLNVNAELNIVVLPVRAIESDEAKVLVEVANTEMEEEANELRGMPKMKISKINYRLMVR